MFTCMVGRYGSHYMYVQVLQEKQPAELLCVRLLSFLESFCFSCAEMPWQLVHPCEAAGSPSLLLMFTEQLSFAGTLRQLSTTMLSNTQTHRDATTPLTERTEIPPSLAAFAAASGRKIGRFSGSCSWRTLVSSPKGKAMAVFAPNAMAPACSFM